MSQVPFAQGRPFNSGPVWDQMNFMSNPAPAASASTSAFGGMGGMAMGLNAAQSFANAVEQKNLNAAAEQQFAVQNAMFGANLGKDFLAQNFDRFRSLNDPIRAGQIATEVGPYRRSLTRANLPDLAGKYGSFGAFSYSPV
jgi:glutamate 5-kinase